MHLAHQKMFKLTITQAKKQHGNAVAYTFHPHPVKVLAKESAPAMINTLDQRVELMKKTGLDAVVVEPFDLKFAHLSGEEWFKKIIVKHLHAKGIVAGYDFTFGSHRSGTVEKLEELCTQHQIQYQILKAQMVGETLISSTQIRNFILKGDVEHASLLLGREYFIDGVVIEGMKRGEKLGFPTANLQTENELIPLSGVYACWAEIKNRKYPAVTNIGMNPTFGGKTLTIESHLIDFKRDIYHKDLRLFFVKRIREERPFGSAVELVKQIKKDIQTAKKQLIKTRQRG